MLIDWLNLKMHTEDDGAPAGGAADETGEDGGEFDPDAWLDALDETTRASVEKYATSAADKLKAALEAERKQRKELAKQVKDLASKPVDASQWEAQIKDLNAQVQEASARAAFTEGAAEQGVSAARIGKLFKIARIDELIDDEGRADWDAIKREYGEFFPAPEDKKPPRANAGNGRGDPPRKPETAGARMNAAIRGAVRK